MSNIEGLTADITRKADSTGGFHPGDGGATWDVKLHYQGRDMTVEFHTGSGLADPPTLEDVMECLLSDAAGTDTDQDFESWAADMGYDTDSRKAEAQWRAVMEQTEQLRDLLGADFDAALHPDD